MTDWEALQIRNIDYAGDVPWEEIAEAEAGWAEYQTKPGSGQTLEQVKKNILEDRLD